MLPGTFVAVLKSVRSNCLMLYLESFFDSIILDILFAIPLRIEWKENVDVSLHGISPLRLVAMNYAVFIGNLMRPWILKRK